MEQKAIRQALPEKTILKGNKKYIIDKVLGTGGFGITYRAWCYNGNIRQNYAIKEFFMPNLCERNGEQMCYSNPVKEEVETGMKSFVAEAERLKNEKILHPNIVGINEVFKANNTAYYVMEYVSGKDLRAYVKRLEEPLDEQKIKTILLPVFKAVALLHTHRITHLDIKPDNILLHPVEDSDRIRPVLIDFGLSKHYDEKGNATSRIRMLACSPGYAPNEQYQEGGVATFTPQADVYALAATILFMLTGKDPVIAAELTRERILKALPETVSEGMKNALINALKQNKNERTASVVDFAEQLGMDWDAINDGNDTLLLTMMKKRGANAWLEDKTALLKKAAIALGCIVIVAGVIFYMGKDDKAPAETVSQENVNEENKIETVHEEESGGQDVQEPVSSGNAETDGVVKPEAAEEISEHQTQTAVQPFKQEGNGGVTVSRLTLDYGVWNGEVKGEKPHGKGVMRFTRNYSLAGVEMKNGYRLEGTYENGQLVIGKLYDADGNLLQTVMP